jgi:hypothetical protein
VYYVNYGYNFTSCCSRISAFESDNWCSAVCMLEGNNLCIDMAWVSLIDIFEILGVVYLDGEVIFWQSDVPNVWYLLSENTSFSWVKCWPTFTPTNRMS